MGISPQLVLLGTSGSESLKPWKPGSVSGEVAQKSCHRGPHGPGCHWATVSDAMFLSGAMDNDSNCEVRIISFSNGKTLGGQTAQGLYKIMLREEFARLNELTGSITLTSGVQACV